MLTGEIHFGGQNVPYLYGTDCADELADAVAARCIDARHAIQVIDANAAEHGEAMRSLLARRLAVDTYAVYPTDREKRLSLVESLLEFAVRQGADRNSVIIAMGGGFVGNVAGLAASLLHRGVRLVHLPTTPVAAFDAVLSLKQAVNLSAGKNMCGTYHPASLIACDLTWLNTIPRDQLLTGVAEMAKNVLAVAPGLESRFLSAVEDAEAGKADGLVGLCEIGLAAKRPLLELDPRERGPALVFEYGHTVGHALEFLSGNAISHGEAVAWGMLVAAEVSRRDGRLADDAVAAHWRVLTPLGLRPPREALAAVDRDALAAVLLRDNKRGYLPAAPDDVPMVLLDALGMPACGSHGRSLHPVRLDAVLAAFEAVAQVEEWPRRGTPPE